MREARRGRTEKIVPLIVATSLVMQQLDATAVATALPSMAQSFGVSPLNLHSTITTYLLALGIFLPVSGWLADRLGARRLFCWAIGLFTLTSLTCALAPSLDVLIAARFVQGVSAAMMLPTARLILVRAVPREQLVSALALMSMPAVVGPVAGPLFGGFITDVSSWRGIFWINLPVGTAAIILTLLLIEKIPPEKRKPFDFIGFFLSGGGVGLVIFSLDSFAKDVSVAMIGLGLCGIVCLLLYVRHALSHPNPILDLRLFRHATFRVSVGGGTLFRIGFGALPFMLPLLMQVVFGYSPLQSGAITFVAAIGAFGMRSMTHTVLRRFGFRSVLVWNALICSVSIGLCALFTPDMVLPSIIAIIFVGGVFRALQFTSLNALSFAEVTTPEMSHATTLSQMALRISQAIGVALAALLLQFFSDDADGITNMAFSQSFLLIAAMTAISTVSFLRLSKTAGNALIDRS